MLGIVLSDIVVGLLLSLLADAGVGIHRLGYRILILLFHNVEWPPYLCLMCLDTKASHMHCHMTWLCGLLEIQWVAVYQYANLIITKPHHHHHKLISRTEEHTVRTTKVDNYRASSLDTMRMGVKLYPSRIQPVLLACSSDLDRILIGMPCIHTCTCTVVRIPSLWY